jgi:hypothetical protein
VKILHKARGHGCFRLALPEKRLQAMPDRHPASLFRSRGEIAATARETREQQIRDTPDQHGGSFLSLPEMGAAMATF